MLQVDQVDDAQVRVGDGVAQLEVETADIEATEGLVSVDEWRHKEEDSGTGSQCRHTAAVSGTGNLLS